MHYFYLVADFSELPWTCVIARWAAATGRSLCLTDMPDEACVYLLVGRNPAQLLAALRGQFSLLSAEVEVIWLNDATGQLLAASSPESFLTTLDPAAYAAPCPNCGGRHPVCPNARASASSAHQTSPAHPSPGARPAKLSTARRCPRPSRSRCPSPITRTSTCSAR